MRGACSTHGREFWFETVKERDNSEDLGVDVRMLKIRVKDVRRDGVNWIYLWSSDQSFWLQIQRTWVRFPALPDFLRSSGTGTGSTQPREDN
jgi:hypothetical protein